MVTSVAEVDRLDGRVALISGASSGVGLAAARRFAAAGARVALLARDPHRLDAAVRTVTAGARSADDVLGIPTDVGDPEAVRSAVTEAASVFGGVDTLLNVAGVARIGEVAHLTDDDVAAVVRTNYLGPQYLARECIPWMRRTGHGDIVNVSSEITLDDLPRMSVYRSSKAGLEAHSKALTQELRGDNIRVTLMVLGTVEGTGFAGNFPPGDLARVAPVWEADGYARRVSGAGPPISPESVAEVFEFAVTRPTGLMLDVVHVRAM